MNNNLNSPPSAYCTSDKKRLGPKLDLENTNWLTIRGAKANNLKNIDVKIPLGFWSCVTGITGAGKSTLVREVLYKALKLDLGQFAGRPGSHKEITGWKSLERRVEVGEPPIGQPPVSAPRCFVELV